ncbi:mycothiol transferase [Leucobacter salsicius]|uniref:mycothiol transferase n=1 Tax=Leucobacter salsicius TaxID=664638 RepID=UPI00034C8E22|nr:DUF664 domain-containing protein [Leucobacter salsicius]
MNAIEILIDLARRPQAAAEHVRAQLSVEFLNTHPHHDNSIAWLLWHAAREIDEQLVDLSGGESVWVAQGFAARFVLEVGDREHGYGHAPGQARAIVVHDPDLLIEHLNAVIEAQVAYLAALDEGELGRIVDERWDPPVTLAARMVSMSVDAAEHVAQAAYITGMRAAAFE